jgi:segregation and condensation protein A
MEDPTYRLEGIVKNREEMQDFEGPLSLILMLLSKNKIEIRDIKISEILEQYLAYLDEMQRMDLEIASEFVQMASYLLYIKTRMLLAGDNEVSELEMLMQSLEQMKAKDAFASIQKVTPLLRDAAEKGMLYWDKLPEPVKTGSRDYEYHHEKADLLKALLDVYSRGGKTPDLREFASAAPARIPYGVREKSRELISRLRTGQPLSLNGLYSECRSRSEVVATFISILELCSMGSLVIDGGEGEYSISYTGGDADEILDRIIE